jgi:hypothetical protein
MARVGLLVSAWFSVHLVLGAASGTDSAVALGRRENTDV